VLFLLGDGTMTTRLALQYLFDNEHWLRKQQVIQLGPVKPGEPVMNGQLLLDPELVEFFTTGVISKPVLSTAFPATYITTELAWSDLVLPPQTQKEIDEIKIWIEHEQTLMQEWGMKRKIRPGYRALFHGPSGTGKTLTASLLGKETDRDVFRIDLSMVISKYIGETEKNLSNLFNKAENKGWILFFDEADALFGKRTEVRDAHDKYANQEVSYLLQRIESYPGLVILASNFKSNIDEAFVRRFESMVHFPMPSEEERLRLWSQAFPTQAQLDKGINFEKTAMKYELTGGNIMNIVQYVCLQSLADNNRPIDNRLLVHGIRRELRKEGRLLA
jgi:SpoVK/Ycf46/Vps4 family AAA+-type ATPase